MLGSVDDRTWIIARDDRHKQFLRDELNKRGKLFSEGARVECLEDLPWRPFMRGKILIDNFAMEGLLGGIRKEIDLRDAKIDLLEREIAKLKEPHV